MGTEPKRRPAASSRLRYVCDDAPGIRRVRSGRGFRYVGPNGKAIRDARELARIRALAIPPSYEDVWICPNAAGHMQATARDARGRKQYRYHPQWRSMRDARKFDRLAAFGAALPSLRRSVRVDLALPGLPREKVLATVVWTMSATLVRVGNAQYRRDNGSFGLTTLDHRHVRFVAQGLRLRFPGKSGRLQELEIDDARLAKRLRAIHQLPGQALFQYRDEAARLVPVDSGQVNDYLRERMGEAFTAKDFRTWGATLAAIEILAATPLPDPATASSLAEVERRTIAQVAALLGNTDAVCRKSYVDPCVFAGWRDGRLHAAFAQARGPRQRERAALRFLECAHGVAATRRPRASAR